MALERAENKSGWVDKFSRENAKNSHRLPILAEKYPKINYSVLKQLCEIHGLGNRKHNTTKAAHDNFMKNYPKIFDNTDEKLPALDLKPCETLKKLHQNSTDTLYNSSQHEVFIPYDHKEPHFCANYNYEISHNIREHLALLHKENDISQTGENLLKNKVKSLKRLLKKLPFEREKSDKDAIYHELQHFSHLTCLIPPKILRELCGVIQILKWNDQGYTVQSRDEINLILKGSVMPVNGRKLAKLLEQDGEENGKDDVGKLIAGQCFGSFDGRTTGNSVLTLSPCELIKITKRDFERMKQVVENKETQQKLQLVQSCRLFENWPKVALNKVVDLITWKAFHPGKVLVNEGEACHVIGFLNEGTCFLKRSIDVKVDDNGKTKVRRRRKQMIVGKLHHGDSFGECTILRGQLLPYSVVTASFVQLGIITQHHFKELDDVTQALLRQSYDKINDNLSEEDLQQQYVKQQKKHEWDHFKKNVLHDVILYRSILPGYGKWSRNPTYEDVAELDHDT